jgi:hypothetical protein
MCVAMNVFFWAKFCILATNFFGKKWIFSKCKFENNKNLEKIAKLSKTQN